jgi:hypothetical protein
VKRQEEIKELRQLLIHPDRASLVKNTRDLVGDPATRVEAGVPAVLPTKKSQD